MLLDLRLAWRSLRRSPAFAATAIVTLAIGIGGSTAIFSIVNAVLLRPLPFHDPDRLVRLWESHPADGKARVEVSAANVDDWRQRTTAFEDFALFDVGTYPIVLGVDDTSIQARQAVVSPNLFALLGVRPAAGREFGSGGEARGPVPSERGRGRVEGPQIVLSHALWQRVFGTDPTVIGRTVRIEGVPGNVVVGVMPAGFSFPPGTELWVPPSASRAAGDPRAVRSYGALGRLKPNATVAGARADLQSIAAVLARDHPATNAGWTVAVLPLHDSVVGGHRLGLMTLFAAVASVMLVGCANMSNLLLARGVARRNELAIRSALGAGRGRIARLLFTETAVLALLGGAAGWAFAGVLLPVLVRLAGENVPRLAEARLSAAALAYCALAVGVTTVGAGLAPALRLSRADVQAAFSAAGERSTRLSIDTRLQRTIIGVELAVSLVLLVGAILFIQTFVRLKAIDLGFDPAHVISIEARVPIYRTSAPNRWQLLAADTSAVLRRLRSIPGVQAVSTTTDLPLSGNLMTTEVTLPGEPRPRAGVLPWRQP